MILTKLIYSLHLSKTIDFIEKMILSLGGQIDYYKKYDFPIKHSFSFHSKKSQKVNITFN